MTDEPTFPASSVCPRSLGPVSSSVTAHHQMVLKAGEHSPSPNPKDGNGTCWLRTPAFYVGCESRGRLARSGHLVKVSICYIEITKEKEGQFNPSDLGYQIVNRSVVDPSANSLLPFCTAALCTHHALAETQEDG